MMYVCGRASSLALLITFLLVGCGKGPLGDQNLPSPDAVLVTPTSDYPAVVMVILPNNAGLCSGTFISPTAVMTAAHCAKTAGRYQVYASFGVFSTYTVTSFGPGVVDDPNDIAVLVFNSPVADPTQGQVANIGNAVAQGDTTTLVGFGCNDIITKSGAGIKRAGTNVVNYIDDYIEYVRRRWRP